GITVLFSIVSDETTFLVDLSRRESCPMREMIDRAPPPTHPPRTQARNGNVCTGGRSWRCMKKDLPGFKKLLFLMFLHRRDPAEKDLLSEDMRRELQRQDWEMEEEEEAMNRPVGPIHYEDIREQGCCSQPPQPLRLGPSSLLIKVEVEIQERRDTKSGVPHVREWDRGKVDFFGKWTSRRRDDSESEFTPRSVYFSDVKRQGYGKWWSEGQGGGHKEPPQAKPKSSSLPQPQSSTPVPS
uniref:CCDC174 alpha/beta GRSR domain-containing protein n=1 Tax=Hucho hucho TaxID=62062 RepID=A0A4W5NXF5_9TELE